MVSLTPNQDAVQMVVEKLKTDAPPPEASARFHTIHNLTMAVFEPIATHMAKGEDEGRPLDDTAWEASNAFANVIMSCANSLGLEDDHTKLAFARSMIEDTWTMVLRAANGDLGANPMIVEASVDGGAPGGNA